MPNPLKRRQNTSKANVREETKKKRNERVQKLTAKYSENAK